MLHPSANRQPDILEDQRQEIIASDHDNDLVRISDQRSPSAASPQGHEEREERE